MIIHISNDRLVRIKGQQYKMGSNFTPTAVEVESRPGDNEIHVLEGERALCPTCGIEFESISANTPAEYASEKAKLAGYQEIPCTLVNDVLTVPSFTVPSFTVPSTDDEAREALRVGREPLVGDNLVGIFDVRRMQGDTLLEAYEVALRAHLEAAEKTGALHTLWEDEESAHAVIDFEV